MRSLLPSEVKIMPLTATATTKLRTDVSHVIGLKNELVISKSPSKSNIMYTLAKYSSIAETFFRLQKGFKKKDQDVDVRLCTVGVLLIVQIYTTGTFFVKISLNSQGLLIYHSSEL